jgi:hypothetical protein
MSLGYDHGKKGSADRNGPHGRRSGASVRRAAVFVKMSKPPLRPLDGAGEPLMLVAALALAAWLGYAVYGDRLLAGSDQASDWAQNQRTSTAAVAR